MIGDGGGYIVPIKSHDEAISALKKMLPYDVRKAQSEFNIKKTVEVYSDMAVLSQYVDSYERIINEEVK